MTGQTRIGDPFTFQQMAGRTAMRIMAVAADHGPFAYRMMAEPEGQSTLALMAGETNFRLLGPG